MTYHGNGEQSKTQQSQNSWWWCCAWIPYLLIHRCTLPPSNKQSFWKASADFQAAPEEIFITTTSSIAGVQIQYRWTLLASGYSWREILYERQMRMKIYILLPSPAHTAQGKQAPEATKPQTVAKLEYNCSVGTPCYTLDCGPRQDRCFLF